MKNYQSKFLVLVAFSILALTGCQNYNFDNFNKFLQNSDANSIWISESYVGFKKLKTITGESYMISSSEELASKTGEEIINQGGNAIDSAIAVQMVLNVIEPHSSGIGGGLFMLYYNQKTKDITYFNGRELSPSKSYPEMFLDEKKQPKNFFDLVQGGISVGVPGALKTLYIVHKKHGKLPWKHLFTRAIDLAENGFVLNKKMHKPLVELDHLKKSTTMKIFFDDNSKPKKIGSIIKNPKLAQTLKIIANDGIKSFYQGKIADDIINQVNNSRINPGLLTKKDFKNYQMKSGKPICINYRVKYKICGLPLPSGGLATLEIMAILENFDLSKYQPNSLASIHLIAQAFNLTNADRKAYFYDGNNKIISKILDKNYLKNRAKLIDLNHALVNPKAGEINQPKPIIGNIIDKPSTTHFAIIDDQGNAVSITSSIEYFYGSGIMVDGFMLNNTLTDFAINPYRENQLVGNAVKPNRRPLSSMSPIMVFDDKNNLILTIGSAGGPRISQFIAKVLIATLDWNLDIQSAISLPNFAVINNRLELEDRTKITKLKKPLMQMGNQVVITDITSGLHGIMIKDKKLFGGAEPRRNGYVATKNGKEIN